MPIKLTAWLTTVDIRLFQGETERKCDGGLMNRSGLRIAIIVTFVLLPFQNCGPLGTTAPSTGVEGDSLASNQGSNPAPVPGVSPSPAPAPAPTPNPLPPVVPLCPNNKAPILRIKGTSKVTSMGSYKGNVKADSGGRIEFVADPGGVAEAGQLIELKGKVLSGAGLIVKSRFENNSMSIATGNHEVSTIISFTADDSFTNECREGVAQLEFYAEDVGCGDAAKLKSNTVRVNVTVNSLCAKSIKLISDNPTQKADQFGINVAYDGSNIAVASNKHDAGGDNVGSVFVFQSAVPNMIQPKPTKAPIVLSASDGSEGDSKLKNSGLLGLSIKGDYVAAGHFLRPGQGGEAAVGAVYIFNKSGSQIQRILPPTSVANLLFGYSVSLSSSHLAIGAPGDAEKGAESGAVYLYSLSNGNFKFDRKITHSGQAARDHFGQSVALSSTHLIAGAPGYGSGVSDRKGKAFLVRLSDSSVNVLVPSGLKNGAQFGYSVAINGSRVAVGATGFKNGTESFQLKGSAFVFDLSGTEKFKILERVVTRALFGSAVSLTNSRLLVGAPERSTSDNITKSGRVLSFDLNSSGLIKEVDGRDILARRRGAHDQFGVSISASGSRAVIGAWLDDLSKASDGIVPTSVLDSGSAHFVEVP